MDPFKQELRRRSRETWVSCTDEDRAALTAAVVTEPNREADLIRRGGPWPRAPHEAPVNPPRVLRRLRDAMYEGSR